MVGVGLQAFILVRQQGQWGGVQVTHDLVQAGDLLFQQVVLLLCDLLPLLGDLQSLQQLSILHVKVTDQHVCFPVLLQLEESEETVRCQLTNQSIYPFCPTITSTLCHSITGPFTL